MADAEQAQESLPKPAVEVPEWAQNWLQKYDQKATVQEHQALFRRSPVLTVEAHRQTAAQPPMQA